MTVVTKDAVHNNAPRGKNVALREAMPVGGHEAPLPEDGLASTVRLRRVGRTNGAHALTLLSHETIEFHMFFRTDTFYSERYFSSHTLYFLVQVLFHRTFRLHFWTWYS